MTMLCIINEFCGQENTACVVKRSAYQRNENTHLQWLRSKLAQARRRTMHSEEEAT